MILKQIIAKHLLVLVLTFSPAIATASTCIVTEIHWHISTSGGMISGVTTLTSCYGGEGSGGGSTGTSGTGSSGGGTTTTTTTTPPPPENNCIVSNDSAFVENLSEVIEASSSLPFGSDPARPGGFHGGMDFFAENGTPIYSPCDGTIIYAMDDVPRDVNISNSTSAQPGNSIVIKPNGSETYNQEDRAWFPNPDAANQVVLDHLDPGFVSQLGMANRTKVHKGQLIAFSDNTGNTNIGPHLHLGIKDGEGNKLDPNQVIECGEGP